MPAGSIDLPDFIDPWEKVRELFPDANWYVNEYGDMIINTGCYFIDPTVVYRWRELLAPKA